MITTKTDREQTLDRLIATAELAMKAEPKNINARARCFIASLAGLMQARGETAIEKALDGLIELTDEA